jgi:hypothetical protein
LSSDKNEYICPYCRSVLKVSVHGNDIFECKCKGNDARYPHIVWWLWRQQKRWMKWAENPDPYEDKEKFIWRQSDRIYPKKRERFVFR